MHRVRFGYDGPRPSFLLGVFKELLQTVWGGFEEVEENDYVIGSVGTAGEICDSVAIYSRADSKC